MSFWPGGLRSERLQRCYWELAVDTEDAKHTYKSGLVPHSASLSQYCSGCVSLDRKSILTHSSFAPGCWSLSQLTGGKEEEEEGLNPGRVGSLPQSRVSTNNNSQSKLRTKCCLLWPVRAGGKQLAAHTDPGVEHTTYIHTGRTLTFDLAERRQYTCFPL